MAFTQVLLLQLLLASLALASHHMGGTVTYTYRGRNPDGTFKVDFHFRDTYDRCLYSHRWSCYSGQCGYNTRHLRGIVDQSTNAPSYESLWCETETLSTRHVPSDKPFELRAASCCWIQTRNSVSSWRLMTFVDLGTRSDTREPNRSPDTAILPFLRVPENCPRTYKLIAFDPDGDKVRCRYGKIRNVECSRCDQPSGFHLNQDSCTLQYNRASSNSRIYGFEMVVEDFPKQPITLTYADGSWTSKFPTVKRRKRFSPLPTPTSIPWWLRQHTTTPPQTNPWWWQPTTTPPKTNAWWWQPTTTPPKTNPWRWWQHSTTPPKTNPWWWQPTTTPPKTNAWWWQPTTTPPKTNPWRWWQHSTTPPKTNPWWWQPTTTPPQTNPWWWQPTTTPPKTNPWRWWQHTTTAPKTNPWQWWQHTTTPPKTNPWQWWQHTTTPPKTNPWQWWQHTTTPPKTNPWRWWQHTTTPPKTNPWRWWQPTTTPPKTNPWRWWQHTTTPQPTTTSNQQSPLSKLPLHFSFLVDSPAPSCQPGLYIPQYLPPTPSNGAHIQAEINKEVEIRVKAQTAYSVIDNIILSGPQNTKKLKTTHNEFVITWTPTAEDLGNHYVICFAVESKTGSRVYQSDMRCVVVDVREKTVEATVICEQSTMKVEVDKSTFPRLHEDHLQLSDPTNVVCSLQKYSNSTHVIAIFPLNACGTQIEEDDKFLKFKNEIITVDNKTDLVTRKHLLEVKFYCQYPKQGNVTQAFTAHRNLTTVWEKGFGKFTYQFEFFPNVQFSTMINPNSYPLEYDLGNRIYMQIEATSSVNNTELFVESCRASPYDNPNYRPTYTIIDNGCNMDSTVRVHPPAHQRQFRFSMEAFKFIGLHDQVYVSCSVLMCTAGDPNTRCAKGCLNPNQRHKRAAVSQSSPHFISQGPLQLKRSVRSASDWTESAVTNLNLNLVFIAGCLLAAVGMISGVAVYKARVSRVKYQPLPTYES